MTKCVGNFVLQAYLFSKSQEADVLFNKTSMTLTMPITPKRMNAIPSSHTTTSKRF
jgi:hypothetical protein